MSGHLNLQRLPVPPYIGREGNVALGIEAVLKTTEQERQHILSYMVDQALNENVELAQKVYSEQIHSVRHDIWDIHTNLARWWVITNPTYLYSQIQFPNMDLAS